MRVTPSSTARRSTRRHSSGSGLAPRAFAHQAHGSVAQPVYGQVPADESYVCLRGGGLCRCGERVHDNLDASRARRCGTMAARTEDRLDKSAYPSRGRSWSALQREPHRQPAASRRTASAKSANSASGARSPSMLNRLSVTINRRRYLSGLRQQGGQPGTSPWG